MNNLLQQLHTEGDERFSKQFKATFQIAANDAGSLKGQDYDSALSFIHAERERVWEEAVKEIKRWAEEQRMPVDKIDTDLSANVVAEMYDTKLEAFDYGTNSFIDRLSAHLSGLLVTKI